MNSDNPRFIDNGDGTVTLPALGLMFSQATITKVDVTQHQAEDLCRELRLAGHADWRLPADHEMLALVDRSRHNPAIDTTFFPDTKPDWYWTSTVCAWSSALAWYVYFNCGGCYSGLRDYDFGLVRAVRSVPADDEPKGNGEYGEVFGKPAAVPARSELRFYQLSFTPPRWSPWMEDTNAEEWAEQMRANGWQVEVRHLYDRPQAPPVEGFVQWLRNNYQNHPNIASLCDAMREAANKENNNERQ